MHTSTVIIQPIVTEKASGQQEKGQYSFLINRDANKTDLKRAVKEIYGVEVEDVRIMLTPKKTRMIRRGKLFTKRPVGKKAIITIKGGKTIDPYKLTEAKKN